MRAKNSLSEEREMKNLIEHEVFVENNLRKESWVL